MIAAAVVALAIGGFAAAFPASATVTPSAAGNAVVTDSITTGDVTGPDAIVNCATSQIAIGGTEAIAVPVACLMEYNGEWYKVSWTGTGISTELTQQGDGNFVLYAGNGKKWGAATAFSAVFIATAARPCSARRRTAWPGRSARRRCRIRVCGRA